jgi:hypothetical protein
MSYELDEEMKNFLIENKTILQKNDLTTFYELVSEEFGNSYIMEFTKFFLDNNVDILKYFKKSIPMCVFWEIDTKLPSTLRISENIETIGYNAFRGNSYINKVILPNSLKYLGACVFRDCSSLQEVHFHSIPEIDQGPFYECPKLKKLYVPYDDTIDKITLNRFEYKVLELNNAEIEWV